jgi:hypothetical protein
MPYYREGELIMKTKLVQVKMSDDTLEKIENVKVRTHAETTTSAIRSSIAIADMVTDAVSKGSNVIIEERSGVKYRITIPGIKNG